MKYDQYVKNTVNEKTDTGLLQVSREIFVFIIQNAHLERKIFYRNMSAGSVLFMVMQRTQFIVLFNGHRNGSSL